MNVPIYILPVVSLVALGCSPVLSEMPQVLSYAELNGKTQTGRPVRVERYVMEGRDMVGVSGATGLGPESILAVTERKERLFAINIKGRGKDALTFQTLKLKGNPPRRDMESLTRLKPGVFMFGTENPWRSRTKDSLILAHREGNTIRVKKRTFYSYDYWNLRVKPNHGLESLCSAGPYILAVSEDFLKKKKQRRFAPVFLLKHGRIQAHGLFRLSTDIGKYAGLDCRLDERGNIRGYIIERHYEVMRVMSLKLEKTETIQDGFQITPALFLELGPFLLKNGNPEGLVLLKKNRIAIITDNDTIGVIKPTQLILIDIEQ